MELRVTNNRLIDTKSPKERGKRRNYFRIKEISKYFHKYYQGYFDLSVPNISEIAVHTFCTKERNHLYLGKGLLSASFLGSDFQKMFLYKSVAFKITQKLEDHF